MVGVTFQAGCRGKGSQPHTTDQGQVRHVEAKINRQQNIYYVCRVLRDKNALHAYRGCDTHTESCVHTHSHILIHSSSLWTQTSKYVYAPKIRHEHIYVPNTHQFMQGDSLTCV